MKDKKFIVALLLVALLSYFIPGPALPGSWIPLQELSSIGIFLIFLFYGLKLDRKKIASGLRNFRLHLLIQLTTFILFPLIVLVLLPFLNNEFQRTLWLGIFFLAALPSTVSTSVVMIAMARGNLTAGIFNASLSGLIGIVVTPLWMGIFLAVEANEFNFSQIYLKLIFEIILPVLLGILLQPRFHSLAVRFSRQITIFDKSVILLIIYRSFAFSFANNLFCGIGLINIALLSAGVILLFFVVYAIVLVTTAKLRFNREDRITALICATQKSLVHGSVFSDVFFRNLSTAGIMLLPLIIFHTLQIFVFSILTQRYAKQEEPG
ncbi:MAG TPA: bile acid:sodium symporter family protein [Bacteroidales bacterium]|nr:bile acid:sodium symporter family protein [Bacteroidales bacterium]